MKSWKFWYEDLIIEWFPLSADTYFPVNISRRVYLKENKILNFAGEISSHSSFFDSFIVVLVLSACLCGQTLYAVNTNEHIEITCRPANLPNCK